MPYCADVSVSNLNLTAIKVFCLNLTRPVGYTTSNLYHIVYLYQQVDESAARSVRTTGA